MPHVNTLLLVLLIFLTPQAKKQSPNLIILFADDLGYGDLSTYGHPTIRTPNLDALAAGGMKFTNFYSGSPACSASRYALLTGRYPIRSGFGWVLAPLSTKGIHPKEYTLAEGLKEAGYATGCFGKWHLGTARADYSPLANGFDEYLGLPYSNDMIPPIYNDIALLDGRDTIVMNPDQTQLTRQYTERAIQFIKAQKDKPFFVYLPYAMPHVPLHASADFAGKSKRGPYGDAVEEIDWSVGAIRDALDAEGLLENTLILFTSDNGPWLTKQQEAGSAGLLRDGKGSTWEGGMRVPAIAYWKGHIKRGSLCHTPTGVIDMHSTLLKLAGYQPSNQNTVDGKDISSVLLGENVVVEERPLFYYGHEKNKLMAVRKGPWKLHIHTYSQLGEKYFDKDMPLLFNLDEDPSEKYELSEQHPEIVTVLLSEIEQQNARIAAAPDFFTLEMANSRQEHLALGKVVVLKNEPVAKYGKAAAITDGLLREADDYAQLPGFEGTDMEAIIDLGTVQSIDSISAGFVEAHNSWIFLPKKIVFYGSQDGMQFRQLGIIVPDLPAQAQFHQVHYFQQAVHEEYRFLKVVAENIGLCPDWHIGQGKSAWIFTDEVIVK